MNILPSFSRSISQKANLPCSRGCFPIPGVEIFSFSKQKKEKQYCADPLRGSFHQVPWRHRAPFPQISYRKNPSRTFYRLIGKIDKCTLNFGQIENKFFTPPSLNWPLDFYYFLCYYESRKIFKEQENQVIVTRLLPYPLRLPSPIALYSLLPALFFYFFQLFYEKTWLFSTFQRVFSIFSLLFYCFLDFFTNLQYNYYIYNIYYYLIYKKLL